MTSFTITELAREHGITTRTIRFYEDQGLIAPLREGQRRIYSPRDRVRLKLILRGKRLGLSLSEIREILDLYDLPEGGEAAQLRLLRAKIRDRRFILERQRQDITMTIDEMLALEAQCDQLLGQMKREPGPSRTVQVAER